MKNTLNIFNDTAAAKPLWVYLLAALVMGLLTGCAATSTPSGPTSDKFQRELATNTFASGYRQISERYIKAIPAAELALEGLRGLAAIDPTINVTARAGKLSVTSETIQPHRYPMPAKNDFRGWAEVTVQALNDARHDAKLFKNTKMDQLYEAVFDGSLSLLDAFSRYASAERAQRNREKRSGFGGIGIRFKHIKHGIAITQVFPATPAAKAGLRPRDIITHAAGQPLAGLRRPAAGRYLRGEIGSIIDINVLRPKPQGLESTKESGATYTPLSFSIRRDRIIAPTAFHSVANGIVYIRISGFNNRTTRQVARSLVQGLREAQQQSGKKASGIILDLRGNPGGLLRQAVNVSDLFLVGGRIISTRGRHPASDHDYDARGTDLAAGLPLVVLINGRSASAAEIVAAALQDHERAIVIGSTSYGKGTVQTVIRLPNDAEITLTWSRFQAPSGYFLHELGVPPSICANTNAGGDAGAYIEAALSKASQHSAILQAWHAVLPEQKSERARLKAICPATNKRNPRDIKIAEKLLLDAPLYQRVKALRPSIASTDN